MKPLVSPKRMPSVSLASGKTRIEGAGPFVIIPVMVLIT
jgi:hypothetical protein